MMEVLRRIEHGAGCSAAKLWQGRNCTRMDVEEMMLQADRSHAVHVTQLRRLLSVEGRFRGERAPLQP